MPRGPSEPMIRRGLNAAGRMDTLPQLKRGLGSPALFGIVQGFIGASVYFAVGVVAAKALGFTWAVFLAGAVYFAVLVPSYVEGASLHQERGGATVIARHAFNELWSFVAGWAILLDYLILIALTAFATTDYAAVFFEPFDQGVPEFLLGAAVVIGVAVVNARGSTPRRFERAALIVLADLVLQLLVVAFGIFLILEPEVLTDPGSIAGTPPLEDLVFAFPFVLVAFSGIDASSGLAGQVAIGRRGLRRLIGVRLIAACVPYVGIALVASVALPTTPGTDWVEAPMVGVADAFQQAWIREPLRYALAISGLLILVAACNAAMLGLSRLGYALAVNRQIPSLIGYLHPRRSTPVVVIAIGTVLAIALLLPADLDFLVSICAFGATIAFSIVAAGVIRLRWKEPDRDRPYKMPLNVRLGRGELPLPALLGMLLSLAALGALLLYHGDSRWMGIGWMTFGVALYVYYRISEDKPVFRRVTVPEKTLTRPRQEAEYGSILVPIRGLPLDDDIVQTAGRLAAEENDDLGEGGAVIEALWVFEVPMALPLDARVPDEELKRARRALARAKAVGEEYEGVEVATAVVRARRTGEAIVHEAGRRGVEAIVLAAEEKAQIRGGTLLGGKAGLRDTFVGETTRYVVNKAPCRVILTAAPPAVEPPSEDISAPPPGGDPARPGDEPVVAPR
ncbi:MAG TPA: amino acid permease [Solirubrobacteraceae bacterium]|nr:amino acid permease [Solirubrobacteraceae bacterium]